MNNTGEDNSIEIKDNNKEALESGEEVKNKEDNDAKAYKVPFSETSSSSYSSTSTSTSGYKSSIKDGVNKDSSNEGCQSEKYQTSINTLQIPIDESNSKDSKKINEWKFGSFNYYHKTYITIVCVISLLVIAAFVVLAYIYQRDTERIVKIQMEDYKNIEQIISRQNRIRKDDRQLFENVFENHENRMENIMELQHAKLESDFNFISVWGAALTIVFLVFSIYSIFKTDEMLKHAEEESKHIHSIYQTSKQEAINTNNLNQTSYAAVNSAINELQHRIENVNILITQAENRANSLIKEVPQNE